MRAIRDEQKRVDDMHMTERLLDQQVRDKCRRIQAEKDRDAEELAIVAAYQAARDAAEAARDAHAKAEALKLSDAIKRYNECAPVLPF